MSERRFFTKQNADQIQMHQAQIIYAEAQKMAPGVERDRLIRQARQLEVLAKIDGWIGSSGLQPPS